MSLSFRSLALLSFGNPSYLRFTRVGFAGFLILAVGLLLECRANAQNIPEVPSPTCVEGCGSGSSSGSRESDEDRQARREAEAEARAERKAERDRQKAIKDAQKLADKQRKDEAIRQAEQEKENQRLAVIDAQRRQEEAQRQQAAEAERQRQLAAEAERLQAAFNAAKPGVVSDLKGIDGAPAGANGGLGLKGPDDGQPGGSQAAWAATITDPQAAVYAHHLASIVPPMPISEKEVAVTWKQVYLNDDRLMNTTDQVVTAWNMTGVLGKEMAGSLEWIIIGGKTLIAGEDGAYLHLVNQEKDYDAALAYLKNPAQAQKFAHLVQDVRESRTLPPSADPAMVKAARAITDPKLGNSGVAIAIDSMVSKEALSAMLRKAAIEVGTKKLGDVADDLIKDMDARKAIYDSVRLDREGARHMLAQESITAEQRAQYKAIIDHANQATANIYRVEKVVKEGVGEGISEATDKIAETLLGPETKGREY